MYYTIYENYLYLKIYNKGGYFPMKFSFKRFLSSALAAVMTVSVLSVGMVTSVSAATVSNYYVNNIENSGTISSGSTLTFSTGGSHTIKTDGGSYAIQEGTYGGDAPSGVTWTKRLMPSGGSRKISINLLNGETADFYISITNGDDAARADSTCTIKGGTQEETLTVGTQNGKNATKVSFTANSEATYTLTPSTDRLVLYGIVVTTGEVEDSLQYNTGDKFAAESTNTQAPTVSAGAEAIDSITGEEIRTDLGTAENEDAKIETDTSSKGGKITLSAGDSSHRFTVDKSNRIKTGGSTNSGKTYRTITVTLDENQAIVLNNFHTGTAGETGRHAIVDNVKYEAPLEAADVIIMPATSGEKVITFDNNVNFTGVSIVEATMVDVPTVKLDEPEVSGNDVVYTATIKG